MKKLILALDELRVETFETARETLERGTVEARGDTEAQPTCQGPSCLAHTCGCYTWDAASCYPETYCIG